MNVGLANLVFNILIAECEARESSRIEFVRWFTDPARMNFNSFTNEFRFQGSLGFGGKLWLYQDGMKINCYPEDMNAKRKKVLAKVNTILSGVTL